MMKLTVTMRIILVMLIVVRKNIAAHVKVDLLGKFNQ